MATTTATLSGIVLRRLREMVAAKEAHAVPDQQLLDRFVTNREELAFKALVWRHGPLVLGVCRRVLRHEHDAEDAFQATFLVLARKAASINKRASVGSWLYQVAYHVANKARKRTTNRQQREERAAVRRQADTLDEVTGRELLAVLDEELQRLPERCREALVLCYLQGLTRDEAARQLGCSESTLKRRLEEGKGNLRQRLTRRGLMLPAALLAAGVAASAVPARLTAATARAALGNAALVSAEVAALMRGALRAMTVGKLKAVGATLLAVALVSAGLFGYGVAADPPRSTGRAALEAAAPVAQETPQQAADAKPGADEEDQKISGRVLDPDGKPAIGAKVYLLRPDSKDGVPPPVRAVTDENGRFSFAAPRGAGQLFVTAGGCGPAWIGKARKDDDAALQLARDDVPVNGRLLDLQGQPIAGATIRVHALKASPEGKLDQWLEAVKVRRDGVYAEYEHLPMFAGPGLAHFFPPVTTDKEGRFQIKGIGRERAVALLVEAPTIETQEINVLTRPGVAEIRVSAYNDGLTEERLVYHPPTFDHAAAPCRILTGVVREKGTGKPVVGAVVRSSEIVSNPVTFVQATTDKEGHYRLTGLRRKPRPYRENTLIALPPTGEPLLTVAKNLPEGTEVTPTALDFDLPQGVWLEGQVKDKVTGRGVEARLGYLVFAGGANDAEVRQLYFPPVFGMAHLTDKEGKFRLVAAPCRGLIGARANGEGREHYRVGVGAEGIKDRVEGVIGGTLLSTYPHHANPRDFDAIAEINPNKGADTVICDLVLDPGRTLTMKVIGPDGKPLEGVRVQGQFAREYWGDQQLPAEFTVYGLEPGKGRMLLLQHLEKNLAGWCEIKADERGPVTATLQPAAAVAGRLVDENGRPLSHLEINVYTRTAKDGVRSLHSREFRTDADGKFRIVGLLPGRPYAADVLPPEQPYRRMLFEELSLKDGEMKDLGEFKPRKGGE